MTVTVYADVFFIINLLLDCLFLYITSRISHTPCKIWRIILGGAIGSLYSIICLTVNVFPLLHIAVATGICAIALGTKRIALHTVIFILTAALTGGAVYGIYFMSGNTEPADSGIIWLCIFIAVTLSGGYLYVCRKNSFVGTVYAYITAGGKEYKAFLLKDSGNLLSDPISLDPVMVVAERIFGQDIRLDGENPTLPPRIIPIKTATGRDILYGFKPEKCTVREFGKAKRREVRVVVAITASGRFDGAYDGLMPPI